MDSMKQTYMEPEMSKEQVDALKQKINEAKFKNNKERKISKFAKASMSTAAAVVAAFVILPNTSPKIAYAMEQIPVLGKLMRVVTSDSFEYESERHTAYVDTPKIDTGNVASKEVLSEAENQNGALSKLETTTQEINIEIEQITADLIADFKESAKDQMGYQEIIVDSEVLTATEKYFSLKLICYRGAGSGYAWNYYYTIDLANGERMQLADIFMDDADFVTPISENIKKQMREQMAADDMVSYWLDHEVEEWNFKSITPETSFYLNGDNNVVIGFNEGDVAPMYMGALEFEIPADVLEGIRK